MATPTTFPSAKQILGFNKETTQGTGVITTPVFTVPIDTNWSPALATTWLDDKSLDQSMGDIRGRYQGPLHEELSWGGPVYLDQLPLFLNNILGDITTTGTLPNSHAMSLLNSGTAQPGSLTLLSWQGPTATTQSRSYPGVCLSELTITGNPDSSLLTYSAKALSWPSSPVPTTPVVYAPTAVQPLPAWRFAMGLGGVASGGSQIKTLREWSVTIARSLKVENTSQNSQNPYLIQRGIVAITGSMTCTVPADETFLNYYINNTQPQWQALADVGTGATNFGITIDMQQCAFDATKLKNDEEAIGYDGPFVGVKNTTNAGASGGTSQIKVTVRNQTASGSY